MCRCVDEEQCCAKELAEPNQLLAVKEQTQMHRYHSRSHVSDETAVLQCKVEGDPPPTVRWAKGNREILNGGRFRHMTDGETNTVSLALLKCRSQVSRPLRLHVKRLECRVNRHSP